MGKDDRHDPRWRWRDLRRHADEREKRFLLACQFRRRCTPDDAAEYFPECDHDSCGFERSLAAASGRRWGGWGGGCLGRGVGGEGVGDAARAVPVPHCELLQVKSLEFPLLLAISSVRLALRARLPAAP